MTAEISKPDVLAVAKNRRSRWYQFSLRSVLILMTLVGLFLGLIVRPAVEQKRIVTDLKALGANVGYDRVPDAIAVGNDAGQTWLDRAFGIDLQHSATSVSCRDIKPIREILSLAARLPSLETLDLAGCDVSDDDLKELRLAATLKELRLDANCDLYWSSVDDWRQSQNRAPRVGDRGLEQLAGLHALEKLTLRWRSKVTDAGISHLANLRALKSLDLTGTRVTNEGIASLNCQTTLEDLDLRNCGGVDDTAMTFLGRFKSLRRLNLGWTRITDVGIAQIAGLSSLEELELEHCDVTDTAMTSIGKLGSLESLNLCDTIISDAGLRMLEPIGELHRIDLGGTKVTAAGVEEVAKRLHVREWVIPQDWAAALKLPKGQSIVGMSTTTN